jgi:hypothetical protein
MNRNSTPPDDSWENDAVWKLLEQATPLTVSACFLDDTVRAAKLEEVAKPWWKRIFSPAPLAGIAAATAAIVFSAVSLLNHPAGPVIQSAEVDSAQAADIQEIAETETLIVAVDHLEDFSDTELVSLIGF